LSSQYKACNKFLIGWFIFDLALFRVFYCLAMDKEKSNKHRDVGSIGQNREKKDIQTNFFKLSLSDKFLNIFCQYYFFYLVLSPRLNYLHIELRDWPVKIFFRLRIIFSSLKFKWSIRPVKIFFLYENLVGN
jgi:hypothetical protein